MGGRQGGREETGGARASQLTAAVVLEAVLAHEQRHQSDVAVVHRLQRDPRAVSNKRAEASAVWLLPRSRPAPGSSEPSQKRETHLLQSKFACVTRSFIPSRIFLSREPWRSRASNMVECVVRSRGV